MVRKNENGSLTVFVLIACMIVIIILLLVDIGIVNSNVSEEIGTEEIAEQKNQNETDLSNTYENLSDENRSAIMNELIDVVYPVGSIYISTSGQNPSEYLGGEWQSYGEGRTLVGVDSSDSDFAKVGATGGEKTHKLTLAELPSHTHTFSVVTSSAGAHTHGTGNSTLTHFALGDNDKVTRRTVYGGRGTNKGYTWTTDSTTSYAAIGSRNATSSAGAHTHSVSGTTAASGSGGTHNNMQPYIVTYMWERVK